MSRFFLGLDSSTQSLSAAVIDLDARSVVAETSVSFDEGFPAYGTRNGTLRGDDPTVVHAPPLVWVEALDRVLADLHRQGGLLEHVCAVSGSGQQHGSVYLTSAFGAALASLDPDKDLAGNLRGVLARDTSPIWMDSSTTEECAEIRTSLGGLQATAEATGSTTFERFTGPQIRKFWKQEPEAYERTAHIALVSSFLASLLAGRVAPIDPGDGAGMNLMDIGSGGWHAGALDATAPGLGDRLPPVKPSWHVVGPLSRYFVERYGFSPEAKAVAWSGDNPNSVVGLGLVRAGMVAISLGTSDTYFGTMDACRTDPNGEGHVFGSPAGGYMTLICFKNGSLAREAVRDAYGLDWAGFSSALQTTAPGNGGAMMLPYFEPEIVPHVLTPGVRRKDLPEGDAAANCRAVVEAQMMSMRIHSGWMGVQPSVIYATGGASANRDILQVMADVHQCPVQRTEVDNSAALGAALRAAHAWLRDAGEAADWTDVVAGLTDPVAGSEIRPADGTAGIYGEAVAAYAAFEREATGESA